MKKDTKHDRLLKANKLIATIATCGRLFFSSEKYQRISRFEIHDNGRLYYFDKHTAELLPLSHTKSHRWDTKFSDGGTLKALIEYMAHYIRTGRPITNQYVFGPWEEWMCNGDLWGYGDDMNIVRNKAMALGIFQPRTSIPIQPTVETPTTEERFLQDIQKVIKRYNVHIEDHGSQDAVLGTWSPYDVITGPDIYVGLYELFDLDTFNKNQQHPYPNDSATTKLIRRLLELLHTANMKNVDNNNVHHFVFRHISLPEGSELNVTHHDVHRLLFTGSMHETLCHTDAMKKVSTICRVYKIAKDTRLHPNFSMGLAKKYHDIPYALIGVFEQDTIGWLPISQTFTIARQVDDTTFEEPQQSSENIEVFHDSYVLRAATPTQFIEGNVLKITLPLWVCQHQNIPFYTNKEI